MAPEAVTGPGPAGAFRRGAGNARQSHAPGAAHRRRSAYCRILRQRHTLLPRPRTKPDDGAPSDRAPSGRENGRNTMAYDLLIRNGRVVDGSGEPAFQADM